SVFYIGVAGIGLITLPIEAMVDVPLSDNACVTVGTRLIPAIGFASAGASTSGVLFFTPGVFGALHFDLGGLFFHPEIAVNGVVPLIGAIGSTSSIGS